MDASFESLCSPQAFGIHQTNQSESRPNFLSAIKNIHQSLRKPLRLKPRANYGSSKSSQSSIDLSRGSPRSYSGPLPIDYYEAPRRQGFAPDMDDYLSLDQLEGLWQYQDSYVGPVATPLTSLTFNYQEAVEAPTFVQHKRPDSGSVSQGNSVTNLGVTGSNEALVVDGYLHPAVRSTPNLSDTNEVEPERVLPPTSAFNVDQSPTAAEAVHRAGSDAGRSSPPTEPFNRARSDAGQSPSPAVPINRARIANDFPRLSAIGKPLVSKNGKPVMSKMAKPVPIPTEHLAPSWTQRRHFLREVPGVI